MFNKYNLVGGEAGIAPDNNTVTGYNETNLRSTHITWLCYFGSDGAAIARCTVQARPVFSQAFRCLCFSRAIVCAPTSDNSAGRLSSFQINIYRVFFFPLSRLIK